MSDIPKFGVYKGMMTSYEEAELDSAELTDQQEQLRKFSPPQEVEDE